MISMADILSGKLDLGDDFDQYNETVMDKQNGKETSNVSHISFFKIVLIACGVYYLICYFSER